MKTRVISGVVAALLGALVVWQYYTPIFDIAAFAVYTIAIFEIYRTFKDGNSKVAAALLVVVGALIIFDRYYDTNLIAIAVGFTVAAVFIVVFDFENIKFTSIASSVVFAAYVLFGIYNLVRLKRIMPMEQYGYDAAFLVILCAGIAWGGDIMAYFSGYLFVKHKMAPKLSPKKTIEGAVGGVLGAGLLGLLYSLIARHFILTESNLSLVFAVVCMVGALLSIIGDLAASAIKRNYEIKDYGTLIPGHGGILDRFDSVIFIAPIIYYFLIYTIGA